MDIIVQISAVFTLLLYKYICYSCRSIVETILCIGIFIGILPETRYFLLAFYRYFRENLDSVIFLRPRWQPCMAIQWIHNLKYFSQVRLCHLPSLVFSPKTLENPESPEVNTLKGGGKLIVLLCCNLTEEVLNVCESHKKWKDLVNKYFLTLYNFSWYL